MPMRMTISAQLVLQVLLADPGKEMYGLQIGNAAGLASGTVHPVLARLEGRGWLSSRWQDIDPSVEGRPARRYYKLTAQGAAHAHARAALARARRPRVAPCAPPLGQGA